MELFFLATIALGTPVVALVVSAALWSRVSTLSRELASVRARFDMLATTSGLLERRLTAYEAAPGAIAELVAAESERRRKTLSAIARLQNDAPETIAAREAMPSAATVSPIPPAPSEAPTPAPSEAPTPVTVEAPPSPRADVGWDAGLVRAEPPRATPIAWEQWLGVRGAAALGAAVLILAGIYFFQYSIEHGLLGPGLRVTLGAIVGVGCIAGAEIFVRRRHALLANCLVGAGVALSYLTAWAASAQFALVSHYVTGGAMIAITGLCCWLSLRRASAAIAIFGLLGGFATPVLLSTGSDSPVALFSYLLLLDAALLYVAHIQRWPLLAVSSLVGTAGYQSFWIADSMGPHRVGWAMLLSVGFGAVFAIASSRPAKADEVADAGWSFTRAAAVLLPFAFAFYAGVAGELAVTFTELCLYLGVLIVGAFIVARRDEVPWLGLSGACASLGVLGGFLVTHDIGPAAMVFLMALALIVHGFVELEARGRGVTSETALAGLAWNVGVIAITAFATLNNAEPLPWLGGWLALAALGMRQARVADRPWLALAHGWAFGLGIVALVGSVEMAGLPLFVGAVLSSLALFGLSLLGERGFSRAATAVAISTLIALAFPLHVASPLHLASPLPWTPIVHTGLVVASVVIALVAARRHGGPSWLVATHLAAVNAAAMRFIMEGPDGVAFVTQSVLVLIFALAPLAFERNDARYAKVAAFAIALGALPLIHLHRELFGDAVVALTPLTLAALSTGLAFSGLGPAEREGRRSVATWLGSVAVGLVTIAMPLQLGHEALTIAWALEGLALLLLWRSIDHSGLKYAALALMAVSTWRLLQIPEVIDYHPRSGTPVFNWLATTYLVPALACGLGAFCLADRESSRARIWEGRKALGLPLLGGAALALVFVWLNLTIVDAFAETARLSLAFEGMPTRDLTLSLAWAAYSLALLALGTWQHSRGLRLASLVLMLGTCAKVFLADLAHLEDLHRVMSLVGLAISLIAVSFAYKRFVLPEPQMSRPEA